MGATIVIIVNMKLYIHLNMETFIMNLIIHLRQILRIRIRVRIQNLPLRLQLQLQMHKAMNLLYLNTIKDKIVLYSTAEEVKSAGTSLFNLFTNSFFQVALPLGRAGLLIYSGYI